MKKKEENDLALEIYDLHSEYKEVVNKLSHDDHANIVKMCSLQQALIEKGFRLARGVLDCEHQERQTDD